jgi:hypothetical protein
MRIAGWLTQLGSGRYLGKYLRCGFIETIAPHLINPARAGNNIRRLDMNAAFDIVRKVRESCVLPANTS